MTRKDGAVGVDGRTAAQYEVNLEANLLDLLNRVKSGRYKAPAIRRVYIPKGGGKLRPLGIPTAANHSVNKAAQAALKCSVSNKQASKLPLEDWRLFWSKG